MQTKAALEWDRRIGRAAQLQQSAQAAGQVLGLYTKVLHAQAAIAQDLTVKGSPVRTDLPLREQSDIDLALSHLPHLLEITRQHGTSVLAETAERLSVEGPDSIRAEIAAELGGRSNDAVEPTLRFFALALLQPAAEFVSQQLPPVQDAGNRCPHCDSLPLVAVLRPEGDGGKRFLLCSLCLSEWSYRRILCPWCGETDREKLPRYSVDDWPYIRVEACDTCKRYLKSIDLTVDGHAVPMIDDVAAAALDLWAVDHGYTKIAANLLGF